MYRHPQMRRDMVLPIDNPKLPDDQCVLCTHGVSTLAEDGHLYQPMPTHPGSPGTMNAAEE